MPPINRQTGFLGASVLSASGRDSVPYTVLYLANTTTLGQLVSDVAEGRLHAAFLVRPSATQRLLACLDLNDAASCAAAAADGAADAPPPLSPPPVTFLFDEGRGGVQLASMLRGLNSDLMAAAAALSARAVLAEAAARGLSASRLNPEAVVNPVSSSTMTLHPVKEPGAHMATGLSFIDYWVRVRGSFASGWKPLPCASSSMR